ncbi:MAG: transglutaminase family protein [Rhizobiaceae bacterium]
MTALISIRHVTRYRYDRPVSFGMHRLLVRPRDGHDLRVLEADLNIAPEARLHWQFDTFGNSVAHAYFDEAAAELEIISTLLIKRYTQSPEILISGHERHTMPPDYDVDNRIDLAPFFPLQNPEEREGLQRWLDEAFVERPDDVYSHLVALSATIHNEFSYSRREGRGTQSALTTVQRRSGTCRDFAFLFMECARLSGFAARFVTGYLHVRDDDETEFSGGGSTHAWADIYVPGEGWLEFDPTNMIDGSQALIRIAVTRTPAQATPISGTYDQSEGQFLDMSVTVEVREVEEP